MTGDIGSVVLARKWRPQTFSALVGQEQVVTALKHALDAQRLHHAYLFTGGRGVGKTTISRIFAKALNCMEGVRSEPCNVCPNCLAISEGHFVDYIELDAASNRGVDEMTALLDRAIYAPTVGRYKVYMIDEVHMLTHHAFNAMLKTLEEPPAHVKFILATTDPKKIPITVLSRCLQFNLKLLPTSQIVQHLQSILDQEKIDYQPLALRLLATASGGSVRDALSLTDQAIAYCGPAIKEDLITQMLGMVDREYIQKIFQGLIRCDAPFLLSLADEMAAKGISLSEALSEIAARLCDVAWYQVTPDCWDDADVDVSFMQAVADQIDAQTLQLYYQIVVHGCSDLAHAPNDVVGFKMTLLRMLAFKPLTENSGLDEDMLLSTTRSVMPPPVTPQKVADSLPTLKSNETTSGSGVAKASTVSATTHLPLAPSENDWAAIVQQLPLSGMAKQLALQSQFDMISGNTVRLKSAIPVMDSVIKKLEVALQTYWKRPIQLTVQFTKASDLGQTPAAIDAIAKKKTKNNQRQLIESHPVVQSLVAQLSASIVEDSIHELTSPAIKERNPL